MTGATVAASGAAQRGRRASASITWAEGMARGSTDQRAVKFSRFSASVWS